jgi:hypothetical protein
MNDLDVIFTYHAPPDEHTAQVHEEVRRRCLNIARWMRDVIPPCDERDQAINHLDYAMTRANAAVARRGLAR